MTQTTILALGVTEAQSADIGLAAGETATISIFHGAAEQFNLRFADFKVVLVSPGEPVLIGVLNTYKRTAQISGPGVYRVLRKTLSQAFGVAKDI